MGDVIRKTAAAETIIADVRAADTAAQVRGGTWKQLADEHLANSLKVIDLVERRLAAAEAAYGPLAAAVDSIDETADALLGRVSDAVWNEVGRPAQDPVYTLLFPGGIAYYVDGPDAEQPARMELLAELLEANLHPRLDPAKAKTFADEIRKSAADYMAAVQAAAGPRAQLEMYGRMRTAVARNAQMSLSNLKRHYKISGFSEAEVHKVIPDRPTTKKPAAPAGPAVPGGGLAPTG